MMDAALDVGPRRPMESRPGRPRARSGPVTLEEVLAYTNDDVVERYAKDRDTDLEAARARFEDVKRWLWLCYEAKREQDAGLDAPRLAIFPEQAELDEMWHTFILFTRPYSEFCWRFFGRYLHHEPTPERDKQASAERLVHAREEVLAERKQSYRAVAEYAFDKLGEDVARRWYLGEGA